MTRLSGVAVVFSICCLGGAAARGQEPAGALQQKPVKVVHEYIRPSVPTTWAELVARSDLVVEVTAQSSAGGEAKYYGNFTSVVTANEATIARVLYRAAFARVDVGQQVLVLTPGGRVDRGAYIEHVVVEGAEPWPPGESYIAALTWESRLKAYRPTAYYETVFMIMPDGTLRSTGNGPLAREASRLGRAATVARVEEAVTGMTAK